MHGHFKRTVAIHQRYFYVSRISNYPGTCQKGLSIYGMQTIDGLVLPCQPFARRVHNGVTIYLVLSLSTDCICRQKATFWMLLDDGALNCANSVLALMEDAKA